eukprot:5754-Heterococcus_DN1.PRE.3
MVLLKYRDCDTAGMYMQQRLQQTGGLMTSAAAAISSACSGTSSACSGTLVDYAASEHHPHCGR